MPVLEEDMEDPYAAPQPSTSSAPAALSMPLLDGNEKPVDGVNEEPYAEDGITSGEAV